MNPLDDGKCLNPKRSAVSVNSEFLFESINIRPSAILVEIRNSRQALSNHGHSVELWRRTNSELQWRSRRSRKFKRRSSPDKVPIQRSVAATRYSHVGPTLLLAVSVTLTRSEAATTEEACRDQIPRMITLKGNALPTERRNWLVKKSAPNKETDAQHGYRRIWAAPDAWRLMLLFRRYVQRHSAARRPSPHNRTPHWPEFMSPSELPERPASLILTYLPES